MRTIIDLTVEQRKALGRLSKSNKTSMAEIIRRAISHYLQSFLKNEEEDSSFGIWKNRKTSGLEYQKKIRKDWD